MPPHAPRSAHDRPLLSSLRYDALREGSSLPWLCFSHLRWNFVYQRPQHLMTRIARHDAVYFFEEPIYDGGAPRLDISTTDDGVTVVVPHLPHAEDSAIALLCDLLDDFLASAGITTFGAWYYTPMALAWSQHLRPAVTVYDCMDELSLFQGAPPQLLEYETALFRRADIVFAGGMSLYEAKRRRHANVRCLPSSIDVAHFLPARNGAAEPVDQAAIPHPRIGFAGVIDERMDVDLLDAVATMHPEWQLVLIGPIVKIDPARLPRHPNIHYLGARPYAQLPAYMSGWDIAMLPFARNEATRYISPTKTPEYLAAGCPVVSTPIRDVVCPYGTAELVAIAETPDAFCAAIDHALTLPDDAREQWLMRTDGFLSTMSWDRTYGRMLGSIRRTLDERRQATFNLPRVLTSVADATMAGATPSV